MTYADRLAAAVERTGNPCVVGLDPHIALLPDAFAAARDAAAPRAERAQALGDFLCEVIDVARDRVPAVKPQSAFFEVFGADGAQQFERVVAAAKDAGLLVIGDVKRGDIGSTAAAYAQAFLTGLEGQDPRTLCDAITVNPYLGTDSIAPFVDACRACDGGLYVLVRTSNPSSAEFQTTQTVAQTTDERGERATLADRVADAVVRWGRDLRGEHGWSSVGAVVGATHPDELARLRARMPDTPFLLPGYGAQGASARDIVGGFRDGLQGALVSSSRGILFAGKDQPDLHWKDATRGAMDAMATELRAVLLA